MNRSQLVTFQSQTTLRVATPGRGFVDLTNRSSWFVSESGVTNSLLTIFVRHTSASLLIQESADPDVRHDLEWFFARVVPDDPTLYRHTAEGADDMPAHIRAALTQTSVVIPVGNGRPLLGTWQGVYLVEHRTAPHQRDVILHVMGASA